MDTIEVEKRRAEEEFSFGDLKFFHKDCGGGPIKTEHNKLEHRWDFLCERCGFSGWFYISSDTIGIVKTAINGSKHDHLIEYGEKNKIWWTMIQRS